MLQKHTKDTAKPRRFRKILRILLLLLLVGIIADILISTKGLTVTEYELDAADISSPIRIVQLTDLHDSVFGKNNSRLVHKVEEQEPDLILITGDLINSKSGSGPSVAVDLIQELCKIAPVYVSYGNQEVEADEQNTDETSLADDYSSAGAIVLEREWVDIEVNGTAIRLGGIYGNCLPDKFAQGTYREAESEFLKEFQDTDRYKILMCHIPISWINGLAAYDWDVDLVFSGHIHGGQVRLPFIGGVYAPDLGWFPGDCCGVYVTTESVWEDVFTYLKEYAKDKMDNSYYHEGRSYYETTIIVSRGLGNTEWVPRFNNIPEIVVTDLE